MINKVVVHDGSAHADDFLSCCILLKKFNNEILILRRSPTEEDFLDENTWVVDQGRKFDPNLRNFDHHQMKGPPCACTMIMDYLFDPIYRTVLSWPSYVEEYDTGGPLGVATLLKTSSLNIPEYAANPATTALVTAFSKVEFLDDGWLREAMYCIGEFIFSTLDDIIKGIECLDKFSKIEEYRGLKVLIITGIELPESSEHVSITKSWSKLRNLSFDVILNDDKRTPDSYRLIRTKEKSIKFKDNDLCLFTHSSGFLTSFKNIDDWKTIIDFSLEK